MHGSLRKAYYSIVPEFVQEKISIVRQRLVGKKTLSVVLRYFDANQDEAEKYSKELAYIKRTASMPIFPYDYVERYPNHPVAAEKDAAKGLWYVLHNGKKLYFSREFRKKRVATLYRSLLMEQDSLSPHRYMTGNVYGQNPEVFLDVSCAEGILALDLIEKVERVILFECDDKWIEALRATFEPWKEKITIINKFASDQVRKDTTCLDAVTANISGKILIKLDVEGAEQKVLAGSQALLSRDDVILLCCVYHRKNDAEEIGNLLQKLGYYTEFTDGYMFWPFENPLRPPFFRKGLLRAWK